MAKTLVILILLFDGTLVKERLDFTRPMEVHECLMFADDHRETISKYVETKAGFDFYKGQLSLGAKRNLLTNSAEFYDLSYEYINDCLRAGVAFRCEFYRDRDLEPEDSLIFQVTFSPLGTITTPAN